MWGVLDDLHERIVPLMSVVYLNYIRSLTVTIDAW
jgi:hypothetical protein